MEREPAQPPAGAAQVAVDGAADELGAATVADETPDFRIDGYWMGLAKRSFQVA